MKVFPTESFQRIGYTTIQDGILSLLTSEISREYFENLEASADSSVIKSRLQGVEEMMTILNVDSIPDCFDPIDIRGAVKSARPLKSKLNAVALIEISTTLRKARIGLGFFNKKKLDYPYLYSTLRLTAVEDLENRIGDSIEPDGHIKDAASTELRRIRKAIAKQTAQLRQVAQKELNRAIEKGYSTDEQLVIRYGKLVLPVTAEAKRKINGVVLDTSASGQTVYIEPYACTELSNDIRILENDELREIDRILTSLTDEVREHAQSLAINVDELARLDCIRGIARLSRQMGSMSPAVLDDGAIVIKGGKNPELLLTHDQEIFEVVPLDFEMSDDINICIISGPNAGGKSVALKTVGLFAIMTSYGIPIPCEPGTSISTYSKLFSSIGDDQSIEDDLSTFSSSLKRLNEIANNGDERSLVLIDEMGNGTDPKLGASISQAFLEEFKRNKYKVLATTHHVQLKSFALETEGVENASMEFDKDALVPTYRFRKGVPGSSYTFEIAGRMGVSKELISRAGELVSEKELDLDDLLANLEAKEKELNDLKSSLKSKEAKLSADKKGLDEKKKQLDYENDEIKLKATKEAEQILLNANARVEKAVQEIIKSKGDKAAIKKSREKLEKLKVSVSKKRERLERSNNPNANELVAPKDMGPIELGDQVQVLGSSAKGIVVELGKNKALIAIGDMRSSVKTNRLVLLSKKSNTKKAKRRQRTQSTLQSGKISIDVRGKRVNDCLPEVIRFVDESIVANLDSVTILHGTGTGALRKAIGQELSKHKGVSSVEEASHDMGGAGVSIVTLN